MLYLSLVETPEDKTKFEKIYTCYEKKMYAVSYKILKNSEDAEDIVHDTFQVLIENLDKIKEIECHKTWNYIVTIVKNKSINLYHRKKRQNAVSYEEDNILQTLFSASLEKEIETKEVEDMVCQLILKLPERCRYVLYLYYYNEYSYAEIGKMLETTEANARQIARRARKTLEVLLKERGIQYE